MIQKIIRSGIYDLETKMRSMPRLLELGDFFTGAGSFLKVVEAAFDAIKTTLPLDVVEDLEAGVYLTCSQVLFFIFIGSF